MAKDSLAAVRARVLAVAPLLQHMHPSETELAYSTPWQCLAAVMLSAQMTDTGVNKATARLFAEHPTAADIAMLPPEVLEGYLKSINYYRTKAKNLQTTAQAVATHYAGMPPSTLEQLLELPGVGRKTALVVLQLIYNKPEGIVVDTHVKRVSSRLGWATGSDALTVEKQLQQVVPPQYWLQISHWLIWHGRRVCTARSPHCAGCPLLPHCPTGKKQVL